MPVQNFETDVLASFQSFLVDFNENVSTGFFQGGTEKEGAVVGERDEVKPKMDPSASLCWD